MQSHARLTSQPLKLPPQSEVQNESICIHTCNSYLCPNVTTYPCDCSVDQLLILYRFIYMCSVFAFANFSLV